jgi:cytochrome oxidase Cu insertion factor (SCO1/SenC/PrrC family)
MRSFISATFLVLLSAFAAFSQAAPAAPQTTLKVGQPAPDFTLTDTAGKPIKLSDFKGKKNVILAFYVLAFTGG